MLHIFDAVDDGVAHTEVARRKVDFSTQRVFALRELARSHAGKEVKAFRHRTVAPRRHRRMRQVTRVFRVTEVLRRQLADISKPFLNQSHRQLIIFLKIVRAVEKAILPVKSEPADVLHDGVDKLGVLLGGIGVIHAQIALAAVLFRRAEIDDQRLAVTDVQISVRLRRKTGVNAVRRYSPLADVLVNGVI